MNGEPDVNDKSAWLVWAARTYQTIDRERLIQMWAETASRIKQNPHPNSGTSADEDGSTSN